jgi:hypothetical protein
VNEEALIVALQDLAERLDIEVRAAPVEAGGRMVLRGKTVIVLPEGALPARKIEVLASALAPLDLEAVYVIPAVREVLERCKP